jgi:ABC-2 type transport system ATP-binding protein
MTRMVDTKMIHIENLHRAFGRHEALRGLSLSVPEGSYYALLGASGAGKTTTIKVLMNIIRPSSGRTSVLGVDSRRLQPRHLQQIGYVSENLDMPRRMRVAEYLSYLRPFYQSWDSTLERELLSELRLPPERRIGDLSHGMRMKLGLACALPFRPRLLVLDEPFSGLDPLTRDELLERLHRSEEMTVLISSHELAEIEGLISHVGFIDQGRLLLEEPLEEISGRVREVHVTLEGPAALPDAVPENWLQLSSAGNVVRFVDARFRHEVLAASIASTFKGVRSIDVQPVALRSIFTTLARAERDRGA